MFRHHRRHWRLLVSTIGALALLLVLATPALAMGPPTGWWGYQQAPAPAFGEGWFADQDIATAAEMLGIEVEDLEARLWAGETLSQVADELGVDLMALRNAVEAGRYRQMTGGSVITSSGDTSTMTTIAWGGLNLRYGPGTGYGVYATVSYGTTVQATGKTQWTGSYQWTEIIYHGRTLWAASVYLR